MNSEPNPPEPREIRLYAKPFNATAFVAAAMTTTNAEPPKPKTERQPVTFGSLSLKERRKLLAAKKAKCPAKNTQSD